MQEGYQCKRYHIKRSLNHDQNKCNCYIKNYKGDEIMSEGFKKLKRVVLREEFMALTRNLEQALVLQQFLYLMGRVDDFDDMVQELNEFRDTPLKVEAQHGWIYKKAEDISRELFFNYIPVKSKKNVIYAATEELIKAGYLDRRRNPNPEYKWDRTYQYRPNIPNIRAALNKLGFELQGYKVCDSAPSNSPDGNCVDTKLQEAPSNSPDGNTYSSEGKTIPEISIKNKKEKKAQAPDYDFSKGQSVALKALPEDWEVLPALREKVKQDYGLTDRQITDAAKRFKAKYLGEGTLKNDWASMFMYWCSHYKEPRKVYEKVPKDKPKHIDTSNRTGSAPLAKVVENITAKKTQEEQLHSDIIKHLLHKGEVTDLINSGLGELRIEEIDGDCLRFKHRTEEVKASMGQRHLEMILNALRALKPEIKRVEFV